jgi:hypothetical protein
MDSVFVLESKKQIMKQYLTANFVPKNILNYVKKLKVTIYDIIFYVKWYPYLGQSGVNYTFFYIL